MKFFITSSIAAAFAVGLLLTLLFSACGTGTKPVVAEKEKFVLPDSLLKTIKIDTVNSCQLINAITLTGKIACNDDNVARIYPLVSGTITGIKVMAGDYVTAGQTLGVIHSGEMAGYSNDLVTAKTNLQLAKRNLDATEDMSKKGLASDKDLLAAQAAYTQAQSELTRVTSVLKINGGSTSGDYMVKSPVSGFVIEKNVTNDMVIRADNSTSLFTISDLKNVWVLANVYESNITDVHLGDNVNITTLSYPGRVFTGKIDKIFNVLDPGNKVMRVRIVLPNSDYALKPEMYASVTVTNPENRQSICIPSQALIFDNSQYYVLVYNNKADIRITPVQVLSTLGNKTYISAGVQPGQLIIGSQALLIYDQLNN
ncbi:MAG TPA: efflux RND transporter periplasmic adaptor subunit [Chitinophagaceae bacterium]|jgi:cobalt-zinc-cadmium efflux system membrane fusion protein|nr:efflux RND transporter periplasmic adaptor subunit [Chitinophagaceae bacterium]